MGKKLYGKVFRLYGKAFRTNGEVFHVYGKLFHKVFFSCEGFFLAISGIFMMVLRQFWDAVKRKRMGERDAFRSRIGMKSWRSCRNYASFMQNSGFQNVTKDGEKRSFCQEMPTFRKEKC